jgi:hypothetical protein
VFYFYKSKSGENRAFAREGGKEGGREGRREGRRARTLQRSFR